jgi:hypothetical protein
MWIKQLGDHFLGVKGVENTARFPQACQDAFFLLPLLLLPDLKAVDETKLISTIKQLTYLASFIPY